MSARILGTEIRFDAPWALALLALVVVAAALERAGVDRAQAGAIYEILREGDEVRFRHAIPYPAHAQNAVRAALEVVRRAATAEEYEIAALRPQ